MDRRIKAAIAFPDRFPNIDPGPRTPFHGNLSIGTHIGPAKALTGLSEAEARARLHSCVQDIADAQAEVDRVNRAKAIVEKKRIAASTKMDRAERALSKAREPNARADVAGAILRGAEPTPSAVSRAKASLNAAEDEWQNWKRKGDQLEPEMLAAQRSLAAAHSARDAAVAEIVALGVRPLLDALHQAQQRLADVENALRKLNRMGFGILPNHWDSLPVDFAPDPALADEWRSAIDALKTDPQAPLPGQAPPAERDELHNSCGGRNEAAC